MMIEIYFSPKGHLWSNIENRDDKQLLNEAVLAELFKYKREELSIAAKFFLRFASEALKQRVYNSDWLEVKATFNFQQPSDLESEYLAKSPPFTGQELLTLDHLINLWISWNQFLDKQQIDSGLNGREFLEKFYPDWIQVGKVTFHLAENKKSHDKPFAFMATFSSGISKTTGKVLHQPLGKALIESSKTGNRDNLVRLLKPVKQAATDCDWLQSLIQTKLIFRPQAWSVQDAHKFLHSIEKLEHSGITVRTPNWWKGKKTKKAKVEVTVDTPNTTKLGIRDMLRFSPRYSIGGADLSEEELQKLLSSSEGLVQIRGEWIEANPEQLRSAMKYWERASRLAEENGLSFNEAMRLLNGVRLTNDTESNEDFSSWYDINLGKNLDSILSKNRILESENENFLNSNLQASLRPYQKDGVSWLWQLCQLGFGLCLADDMGLGKTVQIISLLLLLQKKQKRSETQNPSLLILPASLLGNWTTELRKFAPSLKYRVLHPSELAGNLKSLDSKLQEVVAHQDVIITTYGQVVRIPWLKDMQWNLLCLDEAQAIKNAGTKQTQAVKKLQGHHRIALTGTPIENRLSDLWSLFDFINPGLLGDAHTFKQYLARLNNSESSNYEPLRKLVQPYILRRLKTDKSIIQDLPEKTELKTYCNLTKQQAACYEGLVRDLEKQLKEMKESPNQRRALVLTYLMKFKQLCNHLSQYNGDLEYKPTGSGKYERLQSLIDEITTRQEKVLIFTQYKEMVTPLANFLESHFGHSGLTLDGSTNVKRRKALVDDFQNDPRITFFVLSIKAGGTGLNLTEACHVIHFDRWWNPAVEDQATDRAFRIGQKRNVFVHKFICKGTIEEKIDKLISDKRALSKQVLEGNATDKAITEMTDEELLDFVSINPLKAISG